VISVFRLEVDENGALLGHYTASGNFGKTNRPNLYGSRMFEFLTAGEGTGRFSWNGSEKLPLL